ncbi:MAG: methionine synthase [bacterium]|nr:methionine synthase [bacterium]
MKDFRPGGLATAIGSFPYHDPVKACRLILDYLPDIPVWPQLPARDLRESMYIQYSEALPCCRYDPEKNKIYFDTTGDVASEMEKFYEHYLAEDLDYFALSPDYAAGFHAFNSELATRKPKPETRNPKLSFVKGHTTGPITFGMTVTDETGKAIIYNDQIFEAISYGLAVKSRWQVEKLRAFGEQVIIFLDEPYLTAYGSVGMNFSQEDVVNMLNKVIEPVRESGARVGIHCCANTDWSMLMRTAADIISFDAYGYMESMTLYPEALSNYMDRGGVLAFGIIPAQEMVLSEEIETLSGRMNKALDSLVKVGIPKEILLAQALITPSCGLGSGTEEIAQKALRLTNEVSSFYSSLQS